MSSSSAFNKIQVFCDFDGTITRRDTVDYILNELADPEWERIEEDWVNGKIGSRECMSRQVALIGGGWSKVQELLDTLELADGVFDFVEWCREFNVPFFVVSDGLDRVIEYLLGRHGLKADAVFSNHLLEAQDGSFTLQCSPRPRLNGCQSGVCKCRILGQAAYRQIRVVIGDGRSDFCWSKEGDLLFARDKLLQHCQDTGLPVNPFTSFQEIKNSLASLNQGQINGLVFRQGFSIDAASISTAPPEIASV